MFENLNFDPRRAEMHEADVLINRGVQFTVPKRSILRYFSKQKLRTFTIEQPYLGTLDTLSHLFLSIEFNEEMLSENALAEAKRITAESAKKCAMAVAVSVLNSKWKIRLFAGLLANYFLWHIQPSKLIQLTIYINQINNLGDFISSIRLMSATRTTAPHRIETAAPAD
ncbi:hypothetical protein [Emticicia sp. TH156]|uniref:hypothetical protein n=1 Tax=Emticicia sp. TH156 TaxID=2067454 RepID=UPI000C78D616|nr:hypothetical protein [Emticicia sp. TH156]PLK44407.1 hypothetical protein C0V77_11520 [Emticicia sp. TH156]